MSVRHTQEQSATPDFLQMSQDGAKPAVPAASGGKTWLGWPTKTLEPVTLADEQGRTVRVRTPVMEMEGLITPTELHYVVQHFGIPEPVRREDWSLKLHGEVKQPLTLNFQELRRFPERTVRTVMECSGSDATYFEYYQGKGPRPSRTKEAMILSGSEWTGTPLAAVLQAAGLTDKSLYVRAEGWDKGLPANATPDTQPFYYDKGLPMQKALHPDTILAWAQNGQLLEHLHGAPVRLLVPGWSGNWSVKWLGELEILDHMPDCWYHYNFYYYGTSPEDLNKELITTIGCKSIITYPTDEMPTLTAGTHTLRGYAWSGAAPVTQVEVSVDGGQIWEAARLAATNDPFLWARWSYVWDAKPGKYAIMSRATDAIGRVQRKEPRYNNMRKNFDAIVGYDVTVE